jgi:hypothetical protein
MQAFRALIDGLSKRVACLRHLRSDGLDDRALATNGTQLDTPAFMSPLRRA